MQRDKREGLLPIVTNQFLAQHGVGVVVGGAEAGLGSYLLHRLQKRIPSGLVLLFVVLVIARLVPDGKIVEQIGIVFPDVTGLIDGRLDGSILQTHRVNYLHSGLPCKAEKGIQIGL